jgi:hypothetical protein
MPGFSFTTIEPNQIGQVTKWDVPINDWLGLKFSSGQNDTLGHQFRNRVEDDIYDDKSEASVDVLNRAYGIDDRLKFTEPMSIQRARLINERKRKEIENQAYFESAAHSWFSGKAAAGFGASMVGSLAHPLDLGLAFLPFVGSEKAAAGVAKMGGGQLERMAARGLLTEERLAAIGVPLPRLSGAMIDGAVNQLAMEVPIAFQKHRDMANYDSSDFAFNVLAGGAFAGGVKSIGLAFERAAKAWTSLDPKIKDASLFKALREIFTREPAGFDADVKLDESTIRSQVTERVRASNPFDEAAVRAGYDKIVSDTAEMFGRTLPDLPQHRAIEVARMTANEAAAKFQAAVEAAKGHGRKGSDPSLLSDIDYATALLWRINSGRGEPIIRYESKTAKVGELFEDAGLTYRVSSVKDGQAVAIQTGSERFSQMYSPELEVIAQKEARGIDLSPEERATVEGLIDPETPNAHSDFMQRVAQLEDELEIPKLMDEQRRINLEEYVAQKRAEYDARVKDVADAETRKATENIRKQARSSLTPEEIHKYTVKAPADDAAIKLVEDEADELIKAVLDSVDSVEDRARLEAEINSELERHGFKTEKKVEQGGTASETGANGKQPWEMTREESVTRNKRIIEGNGQVFTKDSEHLTRENHREIVRDSLREGKPVPPEVLADYPDLAPNNADRLTRIVEAEAKRVKSEARADELIEEADAGGKTVVSIVDEFIQVFPTLPKETQEQLRLQLAGQTGFWDGSIDGKIIAELVPGAKINHPSQLASPKEITDSFGKEVGAVAVKLQRQEIVESFTPKVMEQYLRDSIQVNDLSQLSGYDRGAVSLLLASIESARKSAPKVASAKPHEVGVSAEKAIDAMIPCVTAKAKL